MGLHNSVPTLPPELRDLIVDQLRDDKTTLAECSLVSLGWLNRSRYHLFASVQVADSHDRLHFKAFGHFVGATPSIWKYVRRLRLRGIADEDRTSKLDIRTLAFILNKLFRLHTLELVELVLCASSKPGPPLLPRHMCKVTLDVVSSDSGYRRLVDFLHLFSTIDTFHVLLVGEDIYEDTLSAPMPLNLQISTLVLDAKNPNRPVIEILRRTPTMKTIKSLKAVVEDFPDPKHIGAFLLDIGQTLTDLELHVSTDIEGEESPYVQRYWTDMQLWSCVALRKLHLHLPLSISRHWPSLFFSLSQAPSTTDEIMIDIWAVLANEKLLHRRLEDITWPQIQQLLNRFTELKALTFQLEAFYSTSLDVALLDDHCRAVIIKHLPELHATGVLRFATKELK
ncbi:hypothetical protein AcW1_007933 [Taiwanofungus camphoratus]|nr:hypothetical protein AcW1_007933 [Antrodia cinnamomea]KAI0950689.1 hypothetical protein AcW1_007933 [Antrodia cinnamomea]